MFEHSLALATALPAAPSGSSTSVLAAATNPSEQASTNRASANEAHDGFGTSHVQGDAAIRSDVLVHLAGVLSINDGGLA